MKSLDTSSQQISPKKPNRTKSRVNASPALKPSRSTRLNLRAVDGNPGKLNWTYGNLGIAEMRHTLSHNARR